MADNRFRVWLQVNELSSGRTTHMVTDNETDSERVSRLVSEFQKSANRI